MCHLVAVFSRGFAFSCLEPGLWAFIFSRIVRRLIYTYTLTLGAAVAVALAVVFAVQVLVAAIHVLALEPAVDCLMDVVEVLGGAIAATLIAAWVGSSKTSAAIQSSIVFGGEPAVVRADGTNGILARVVELRSEMVGAAVDVVLDRILTGSLAILTVGRGALHQAGRAVVIRDVCIARRLLHGEESQDGGSMLYFLPEFWKYSSYWRQRPPTPL